MLMVRMSVDGLTNLRMHGSIEKPYRNVRLRISVVSVVK